ncbi:MAG: class I SAM-dependent methyltransferase [Acidobacteriota bacterium]|nr:class I SAM-dependent methyltransferase [Acidobacteriota bacterium]
MTDAFENMDRMYRHQRYFYDLTRKYYLLGRDRLLSEMDVRAGENVLEVGCGTGRNLIILAKRFPGANFFGLDASAEMLKTARAKADAQRRKNITFETALADTFNYRETFGLAEPFDTIFFSYSISMIPVWRESIQNALANLKSGRSFYIVDFYDQKDLPRWFRKILKGWLRKFHVQFWGDLMPYLENLEKQGVGKLKIDSIARRYAFIAQFRKN